MLSVTAAASVATYAPLFASFFRSWGFAGTVLGTHDRRGYLNVYLLVFTVPLTEPCFGVTAASHLPFASLIVQERPATSDVPRLIVTVLQDPVFVICPLVAVSV